MRRARKGVLFSIARKFAGILQNSR